MTSKAFISGLSGPSLTREERAFIADEQPWGFILFARNVESPQQVTRLCTELREVIGRDDAPILIDQEGGRVQRLKPPHWEKYPAGAALGALYDIDRDAGIRASWLLSRLHAFDLLKLGITVDCLPVLDVPAQDGHDVIGDRAYSREPQHVATIGKAAAEGLMAGGVMPVIKHIPGHGRARADSHKELPIVDACRQALEERDFLPFRALHWMPMAMSAHIVFSAIDPDNPATTSPTVVSRIIRKHLGFDGLLMSDDVSMEALSGCLIERSRALFAAGCDVALHCNGDMNEMVKVAGASPVLSGQSAERARLALQGVGKTDDSVESECRTEFAALIAKLPVA